MDREKIIDGLEKLRKDLGYGLPDRSNVIMEYLNSLTNALAMLKEQEPVCVKEDRINKCVCGDIVNRYYHPKFCGYCGRKLLWY